MGTTVTLRVTRSNGRIGPAVDSSAAAGRAWRCCEMVSSDPAQAIGSRVRFQSERRTFTSSPMTVLLGEIDRS